MVPKEPIEPQRVSWGIPLAFAAVVGGLVIWRACTGRGDGANNPALAPSTSGSTSAAAAGPPPAPRCVEISKEPFVIGEPTARRPPPPEPIIEAGPPDEPDEVPEDDLAPFAVEVGRGALFNGGFAIGVRRDAEGSAVAMVATIGLDGTSGKLIRLARSRGDLDPPIVAGAGDAVLAAMLEPNAAGRAIKIAKVVGNDVTWGIELAEGRDESLALELAASGPRALVAWDDVTHDDKRSSIILASFDVASMRSVTSARPVSSPRIDADTPRLVARPGGYWLAYIARAAEVKRPAKAESRPSPTSTSTQGEPGKADPLKDGARDEGDESGETIDNAWLEVMPLDENGAPTAMPRAVTPKNGHALAFDIELGDGGAALIAWRDDDTPTGSSGGRLSSAWVLPGGGIETHVLAEESLGAGVPDLLPGWLAVGGASGATRIALITPKGELKGTLDPEPSLGTGEPIAATVDRMLVARPSGKAMRLSIVRCSPVPEAAPPALDTAR
jgi:hypothetical protein